MWSEGLGASGTVRITATDPPPVRGCRPVWVAATAPGCLRSQIRQRVADDRAAGLLAALVVGDRAAIDSADWDVFRATGVAHLISISGLHITLWAGCVRLVRWAALGAGVRRPAGQPPAAGLHPAPWRRSGVAGCWHWRMRCFPGWGIPAQRTVLMLAVVWGLRLLGRRWPWPVVECGGHGGGAGLTLGWLQPVSG